MLRNQHHQHHHQEDAQTVQVSDTNCHLGQLLLEADWAEASIHLATPEGQRDIDAKNDPLGLFNSHPATKNKDAQIPPSKNAAFFAALFVRAPYEVIEEIFTMAPSHVDQPQDLMYVLSVIPSEEEARLQRQKVPYRTRTWTAEEYNQILNLLLQPFICSKSPSSSLLDFWPHWIVGTSDFPLTPLAIAAYNPDVSATIVQIICTLEPRAMDKECKLFGAVQQTIPLVIAAASPMPPKSSSNYNDAKNLKWAKVKLLTLSKTWYDEQREILSKTVGSGEINNIKHSLAASPPPTPTLHQIHHACEESIRRNEWELVREFLKHYYSYSGETKMAVETTTKDESSILESIQAALAQHDDKAQSTLQRNQQSQEKARAREQWLHKNMGLVMYPVDALVDLVSAVIPSSRKKHDEASSGIVTPMS